MVHRRLGSGSSPHARGTQSLPIKETLMARFIPARAGNAFPEQKFHSPTPVHPRTRGERELMIYNQDTGVGSSPHARGTHYLGDTKRLTTRFIPARAGNAVSPLSLRFLLSVHPRTRGERRTSPRRFIPARAGNALQGKPLKRQLIHGVKQPYRCSGFVHCRN